MSVCLCWKTHAPVCVPARVCASLKPRSAWSGAKEVLFVLDGDLLKVCVCVCVSVVKFSA